MHQIIYSINQITLGVRNMENIVGQPPQPAELVGNRASSSGKTPGHLENTKRKNNN